ncbi:MAG: hypothetical protein CBD02_02715 [Candidatus Pelagibacter sp. TMED142]|nr:MAG: hypothetical protein CBD02_02715 [Candidatus Pelagibacter sp. TMED142]
MINRNIISFFILLTLLFLVFKVNALLVFFIILFIFIFLIYKNISIDWLILLMPFYIFPFMLIFKLNHTDNLLLNFLPDFSILLSLSYIFKKNKIPSFYKNIIITMIFFILTTICITFLHIQETLFILGIIRQYAIPIIFLIIFITVSLKNNYLPIYALKISIVVYTLISIIALMNYFFLNNFESPSVGWRSSFLCLGEYSKTMLMCNEGGKIRRLHSLISGSLGSSSAVLVMLGIVSIRISRESHSLLKYCSIPLFLTAFLSFSVSIVIPIIYFIFVLILNNKKILKIYFLPFIIVTFLFLSQVSLFNQSSIINYFNSSIFNAIKIHLSSMRPMEILFGSGPIINSSIFKYFPDRFIVDIGIFRMFNDTGIFNFILFLYIVFYFIKKALLINSKIKSNFNEILLFMLFVLISLVHSNIIVTPPFYLLFIITCSGILSQHYQILKKNEKI